MSPPQYHPSSGSSLKDSVVVLTGGAVGIGAATVRLLHAAGAHVFFGDVLDEPGLALEAELSAKSTSTAKFVHCDVTSYQDNLLLFDTAFAEFKRVDHAWSNAGIGEQGNIFDRNLTLETVKIEPKKGMTVIDIDLKGPIYFARIASVYLRQPSSSTTDKSLTFTASVAGFREDPGLWVYVPAKHGVLGLMRSLRTPFFESTPRIRTNAICPWMTFTKFAEGLVDTWKAAGLPSNSPEDVAAHVVGVLADEKLSGAAIYIEGGRGWNVEESILKFRPQWLGERQTAELDEGTKVLGGGEAWIVGQDRTTPG